MQTSKQYYKGLVVQDFVGWLEDYIAYEIKKAAWQSLDRISCDHIIEKEIRPPLEKERGWLLNITIRLKEKKDAALCMKAEQIGNQNIALTFEYDELLSDFVAKLILAASRTFTVNSSFTYPEARRPGSPGLSRDDKVTRVAYAIWAIEIRTESEKRGSAKGWEEIADEIGRPFGYGDRGRKKLENARNRYERLMVVDQEAIIPEAQNRLTELKEEKEVN